ncbi:MAG: (Fe-S)-binding protein [Deltaproteobacteria bacterium]|nr:(Fe-S)-binding protein [Deltaproteobacteria bacterium]MBW2131396.1 (Fe-S)-binding protein [Deltaproteobacteria bacterium]
MSDVKAIARLMRELEDQLAVCMRCGMCQAVCPVFSRTGREADVARGKLALLDGLMEELFENPEGVNERLNRCLLCGSCAANCPSGVKVLDIFLKARVILTGFIGLSPAKRLVLRGLLSRPLVFDRAVEWAGRFQRIFTKPANEIVGTSCARIASPFLKDRHFHPLAPEAFHQETPEMDTPAGKSGLRVGFFVGCLIDKVFPRVARASLRVMDRYDVGVFLPKHQGCCGIPALSSGDRKTFLRLLHHNLNLFETASFDVLMSACATCTATIKTIWPVMVQDQPAALQDRVRRLSEKTEDISAFIVSRFNPAPAGHTEGASVVTYHDPCHLKKSLGVFREPRRLIQANPEYRLVEMAEADACCGMGGAFNLQYHEISTQIGTLKRDRVVDTGASVAATGCPACMMQLSDMLSRKDDRISVCHPIEIFSQIKKLP